MGSVLLLTGVLCLCLYKVVQGDVQRTYSIPEGVQLGTLVGYVSDKPLDSVTDSYLLVLQQDTKSVFHVNNKTGEIRTSAQLDYETQRSYTFMALPLDASEGVHVVINVIDQNDNEPQFTHQTFDLKVSEYIRRNSELSLPTATDADGGELGVKDYVIVSGNVNNAFRLLTKRIKNVVYPSLLVNTEIDREFRDSYQLMVEALDGGDPPLRGKLLVNVTVEDANDNVPAFDQVEYSAKVSRNASVGTSLLTVHASDKDTGANGRVTYHLQLATGALPKRRPFIIDSQTGVISVGQPLSRFENRKYELLAVARDGGQQPYEASAYVSITVHSAHAQTANVQVIWLTDTAQPVICEHAAPGDLLARLSVTDTDQTQSQPIVPSMTGHSGEFMLEKSSADVFVLRVASALDRERIDEYKLRFEFRRNQQVLATHQLTLRICDINDNSPQFTKPLYEAHMKEQAAVGASVTKVTAVDADALENARVTYSFGGDSPFEQWFDIDSDTGVITTRQSMDCERSARPQLTVTATDHGLPPRHDTTQVQVNVLDVNDNAPVFHQPIYNISLSEDTPKGTCLLTVSATDPDCGVNAVVQYSVRDSNTHLQPFSIDTQTGQLCLAIPVDYEQTASFQVAVLATDRGGLVGTALLQVTVQDVHDNAPVFYPTHYNISVDVTESKGTALLRVSATDADAIDRGQVQYELLQTQSVPMFRIERANGELYVNEQLRVGTYDLQVTAQDGGALKSTSPAYVSVTVQEHTFRTPIFSHKFYRFSTEEDTLPGIQVGKVLATGRSPITYAIYSGDQHGYFAIDPDSGQITVARYLDADKVRSVMLNVQVASGNPPSFNHTQVEMLITDVNDNRPVFDVAVLQVAVSEQQVPHQPFFAVHAEDLDTGRNGALTYTLVAVRPSSPLFMVLPLTGQLQLTAKLDYEQITKYTLVVSATDNGVPSNSANVTVELQVLDANDHSPVFDVADYKVEVSEQSEVMQRLVQIQARDLDSGRNAQLSYSLVRDSRHFGVFADTGWLYLRHRLDREDQALHQLTVRASDGGSPRRQSNVTVTIRVLDVNDNAPDCMSLPPLNISENIPVGFLVGRLNAIDRDAGENGTVTYQSIDDNQNMFRIEPNGDVYAESELDAELDYDYTLSVRAQDNGHPALSSICVLRVFVQDENDNAPVFVLPHNNRVLVRAPLTRGMELLQLRAIDADQGTNGTVIYTIPESETHARMFHLDANSGVLRLQELPSRLADSSQQVYSLNVMASDQGTPPLSVIKDIIIEMSDSGLDSTQPLAQSNLTVTFELSESVAVGQRLGAVDKQRAAQVGNLEAGSEVPLHLLDVSYTIVKGNEQGVFAVDRVTSVLYLTQAVDYETVSAHHLLVRRVQLQGLVPQSSTYQVTVKVLDENDNAPVFAHDPIMFSVPENARVGQVLFRQVNATDADVGPNGRLTYSLQQQTPEQGVFSVNELTGDIRLAAPLDFETVRDYVLVLAATDQCEDRDKRRQTRATVRVYITDVNDNQPVFISEPECTVSQVVVAGQAVHHVVATDADWQLNGKLLYNIANGNELDYFRLNDTTGALTIRKRLDSSDGDSYQLNIVARDMGRPSLSATQQLRVTVETAFSATPRFTQSTFTFNVTEGVATNTVVGRLRSRHPKQSGTVKYTMPMGAGQSLFGLDETTGVITTVNDIDRETWAQHKFTGSFMIHQVTVFVHDSEQDWMYDACTVHINVLDVNDNVPLLVPSLCADTAVPENSPIDLLHVFAASDADSDVLSYKIERGNDQRLFHLNAATGELSCESLDRESQSSFSLTILVSDGLHEQRCDMRVTVLDANDQAPTFETLVYSTSVSEDITIGTAILTVTAKDGDLGENGRLTYTLQAHVPGLDIDPITGSVFTTRRLDAERTPVLSCLVVATDHGVTHSQSGSANLTVTVTDVNDNRPVFTQPIHTVLLSRPVVEAGVDLVTVRATDADVSSYNSRVSYRLKGESSQLRLDSNSGVLRATETIALRRSPLFVPVEAVDSGNPTLSSICIVQLSPSDLSGSRLSFVNETIALQIQEPVSMGALVSPLSSALTGADSPVQYTIIDGNQLRAFRLDGKTGDLTVSDASMVKYEIQSAFNLLVEASTATDLTYTIVHIQVQHAQDKQPEFLQQRYTASIREGQSRDSVLVQVSAFDMDGTHNSDISYSVVGGNRDSAFSVDTHGLITTNNVLDREIESHYELSVLATQSDSPTGSSTTQVHVQVLDVNDNEPSFPKFQPVSVLESSLPGSLLTVVTANDVDTFPALRYSLQNDDQNLFAIDKFSGRITLRQTLDYEKAPTHSLVVQATDQVHTIVSTLNVEVLDENEYEPEFDLPFYEVSVPENTPAGTSLMQVLASDADSSISSNTITYKLLDNNNKHRTFWMQPQTGALYNNRSLSIANPRSRLVSLVVQAVDNGVPQRWSTAALNIHLVQQSLTTQPMFQRPFFSFTVREDAPLHSRVGQLSLVENDNQIKPKYRILSGDNARHFAMDDSGAVFVRASLDRESTAEYRLRVAVHSAANSVVNSTTVLLITVEDVNDNAPVFSEQPLHLSIANDAQVGSSVLVLSATDTDDGLNAQVLYDITSGNEQSILRLDEHTGVLTINRQLSPQTSLAKQLVIRARDQGSPSRSTITVVQLSAHNHNPNAPFFPVPLYLARIHEDSPIGTFLFKVTATDQDVQDRDLQYNIRPVQGTSNSNSSKHMFRVNSNTGQVYTNAELDYEQRTLHHFMVTAIDAGGNVAETHGQVLVLGVDEYAPQFDHLDYVFQLSHHAQVGDMVGTVHANDDDDGVDGQVQYSISPANQYFSMNELTGVILVQQPVRALYEIITQQKHKMAQSSSQAVPSEKQRRRRTVARGEDTEQEEPVDVYVVSLVVIAKSGGNNPRKTNMTTVDVHIGPFARTQSANVEFNSITVLLVSVLLVIFTLLLLCCLIVLLRRRNAEKHTACASQRRVASNKYAQPPPQTLSASSHQITHAHGNGAAGNARAHLPNCSLVGGTVPLLNGNQTKRGSRTHVAVPPPVVPSLAVNGKKKHMNGKPPMLSDRSSGRSSDEDSDRSHSVSMSRATNRSHMERSQPDSGIHVMHDDDQSMSDHELPSTTTYLEKMGVRALPVVPQQNKPTNAVASAHPNRSSGRQAKDNVSQMHDLIYSKVNEVLADEPQLHPNNNHLPGLHQMRQDTNMNDSANIRTVMPPNWGPSYQPLTQVFSEISRLKQEQDTLRRRQLQNEDREKSLEVPPSQDYQIWLPKSSSSTAPHSNTDNDLEIRI